MVEVMKIMVHFSSVPSLSRVRLFTVSWIPACQASLSITNSRVYSNSRPSSRWCHPAISSSVIPFSSCPQSLPASGSFPMSQFFAWGGQSTGVSASASVLPMNTQDWSPLGWTGWISLKSKGLSRVFSSTTVQKHQCKAWGIITFSAPMSQEGRYRDNGVRSRVGGTGCSSTCLGSFEGDHRYLPPTAAPWTWAISCWLPHLTSDVR